MSSHPNAELLRGAYDAFERGDLQPLLGLLRDDIEWVDSTLGPLAGTYRGSEAWFRVCSRFLAKTPRASRL